MGSTLVAIGYVPRSFLDWWIIILVFLVFLLGISNGQYVTFYVESVIYRNNFLQGALVSFLPPLDLLDEPDPSRSSLPQDVLDGHGLCSDHDHRLLDPPEYLYMVKTCRTIFQSMALGLILLSIIRLYHDMADMAESGLSLKNAFDQGKALGEDPNSQAQAAAITAAAIVAAGGRDGWDLFQP